MIHLTISLIAFALSAFALWLAVVVNRRLVRQNKELLEQLEHLNSLFISKKNSMFLLLKLCSETRTDHIKYTVKEYPQCGYVNVCKEVDGLDCLIKCFADSDQDYNRLCAEELVEILNEK